MSQMYCHSSLILPLQIRERLRLASFRLGCSLALPVEHMIDATAICSIKPNSTHVLHLHILVTGSSRCFYGIFELHVPVPEVAVHSKALCGV